MDRALDTRRILIFLAFAFGIAWATALVIYLTGGLADSPVVVEVPRMTLALILLATSYMGAPALAHVVTRLVTREGWHDTTLRPHFTRQHGEWKYWLAAWLLPPLLIALGGALYFVVFPQHFDPTMTTYVSAQMTAAEAYGQAELVSEELIRAGAVINTLLALVIAPLVNGFFTFGEEFGWRGYLQPKLMVLGGRRAMLLMGLIWGVWHWPVIFMGYEYGFDYPGAPYVGPVQFVFIAFVLGSFTGWVALRGRSVWPAVIAHAMFNGFAAVAVLFLRGEPNPLLGPLPVGVIAAIPLGAFVLYLYLSPNALRHPVPPAVDTALDAPPAGLAVEGK